MRSGMLDAGRKTIAGQFCTHLPQPRSTISLLRARGQNLQCLTPNSQTRQETAIYPRGKGHNHPRPMPHTPSQGDFATRVCGQALSSSAADRFFLNLAAELSASLGGAGVGGWRWLLCPRWEAGDSQGVAQGAEMWGGHNTTFHSYSLGT